MKLSIDVKNTEAVGAFGPLAASLMSTLEGRKHWASSTRLKFETTEHNLRTMREAFTSLQEVDLRSGDEFEAFAGLPGADVYAEREKAGGKFAARDREPPPSSILLPSERRSFKVERTGAWPFRVEPFDYQLANFEEFKDDPAFAIFSEQGTGKTKTALDIVSYRYFAKMIDCVIVLSNPKGVHAQWVEEALPAHLWLGIPLQADYWDGKKAPRWVGKRFDGLQVFSGNIDMVSHPRSRAVLQALVDLHGKRCMFIIDESDSIKNASATRSKEAKKLGDLCGFRLIMTGTPIAKDLTDEWAQFKFLNERFIGHRYKTSFQSEFCRMGGFEGRAVIGHRNLEKFKALTQPHIFRATKRELNLPPKMYDTIAFDLSDEQRRYMKELKESFLAQLDNGQIASVANAAALLVRLQQISCGYAVDEHGTVFETEKNPRRDVLVSAIEKLPGKVIVWCRFNADIELLRTTFSNSCTVIYGATKQKDREHAKEAFLDPEGPRYLVANPAAAGKGVDGLQKVCDTAIYYSNSFNAIERWQSEDRIHRIGMGETASYIDLIARGSPDRSILTNLRAKKSLSDLVLDDIRHIVEEI